MFNDDFYPTPIAVTMKMLEKVSQHAKYFLEPSAGKGDIAEFIADRDRMRGYRRRDVDCIESEPDLISILQAKDLPVVGFDWLEYDGTCYYDAIIMNPPFSNGAAHLLKAWNFLNSGEIVCLLNAETINNPYTAERKLLLDIITQHGHVQMLGDCFSTAQRKTGVEVAMVYLKKEAADDTLDLWCKNPGEERQHDTAEEASSELAIIDRLGNMEQYYNKANEHMMKAFKEIRRAGVYMQANGVAFDIKDILHLAEKNVKDATAEFVRAHKKSAWEAVFERMDYQKFLDKIQRKEFLADASRNNTIPFTKDNIKGTLENVFLNRKKLFEKSVVNVFDALCRYDAKNRNHVEGWKTNSNFKVNKKLIFPYGCSFDSKYGHSFSMSYGHRVDIYNDLDRCLAVLDGKDFLTVGTIGHALDNKFRILGHNIGRGFDNTTESQYFNIKFFKKGTVHLEFKDAKLWEEFNITAAKGRVWLGSEEQQKEAV